MPLTIGPVTRVMLSRHSCGVRVSPAHFFDTAAPPVKPMWPSITMARRWVRR